MPTTCAVLYRCKTKLTRSLFLGPGCYSGTVSLLKRFRNGRFASETAVRRFQVLTQN